LAPLREAERPALFRPVDFRLPAREDLRALFRAELRPAPLADLPDRFADLRALLAALRADFFLPGLVDRADLLRVLLRVSLVPAARLLGEGSSKSDDDDEAGVGEGVLSEGSGSIHPEPDQPISI
jgi:hypothetical protein